MRININFIEVITMNSRTDNTVSTEFTLEFIWNANNTLDKVYSRISVSMGDGSLPYDIIIPKRDCSGERSISIPFVYSGGEADFLYVDFDLAQKITLKYFSSIAFPEGHEEAYIRAATGLFSRPTRAPERLYGSSMIYLDMQSIRPGNHYKIIVTDGKYDTIKAIIEESGPALESSECSECSF